jgi:hypothetical protein
VYSETVHHLLIDFKKASDSVRREVLYNTLIESGIPMKLVRLIKMCLNETYSKVCICKYFADSFIIQNGYPPLDSHYQHKPEAHASHSISVPPEFLGPA